MSTLSAEHRTILILIYNLWVIAGLSVLFLYSPGLVRRIRASGWFFLGDKTARLLFGLLVFVAGTVVGRGYFLMTMRMVNEGEADRLAWWVSSVGWVPIVGQAAAVFGLAVMAHVYFFDKRFSLGWRQSAKHLAIGWIIVMAVVATELLGWWH